MADMYKREPQHLTGPGDNQKELRVKHLDNGDGTWSVSVGALSLPLPDGAATAAKQDTSNVILSDIENLHTSTVSTLNSTNQQLAINQTFTGTWEDVTNYSEVIVSVYTTHTSVTDGLKVEWSMDGTNVHGDDVYTINAQSAKTFSFPCQAKYVRVRYTNDGTSTTTFQLQTIFKRFASKGSSHRLYDNLNAQDDAIVTKSQIVGFTTGGNQGSDLINVKVTPSGALATEATIANAITVTTDNATGDAFSRLRVSNPEYVFDTNFQYDLQPLVFQAIASGSGGATIAHDPTNRNALMSFSGTPTGGTSFMQTYEHFRYQSGRSQLILNTFNFIEGVANVKKFVGYSDGANGIQFELNGTTKQITLYSDTAKGDETVTQANWNIDKLDGTGPSGITLDISKTHIFVIDFQWLGVGRVRCGFDLDGVIVYVHEFVHANHQTVAYMQTANLPIRAGMSCVDTATTTMRFICCSVISEGGKEDVGGYNFSQEGTVTAGNGTRTHVLSIRPKTTFNSITNRSKIVINSVDVLATGNFPIKWELCVGQAISGTTAFTDVNTAYSGVEFNTAGTISGNPTVVIASGYVATSAGSKGTIESQLSNKYPITLDVAGLQRSMGTLTVLVTAYGGTSACRVALDWREIR